MSWHVEIGCEFFPVTSAELLELYRSGQIEGCNLVRRSEVRPIQYYKVSQILAEVDPSEVKEKEPTPPTPFVPYVERPRQRYGELPREYFHKPTRGERIEDIREFLRAQRGIR